MILKQEEEMQKAKETPVVASTSSPVLAEQGSGLNTPFSVTKQGIPVNSPKDTSKESKQERETSSSSTALRRETDSKDEAEDNPDGTKIVDEMGKMVGQGYKWGNATLPKSKVRMELKKPFRMWLDGNSDEEPKVMNCWEACLFAAMKAGVIKKENIKNYIEMVHYGEYTINAFVKEVFAQKLGLIERAIEDVKDDVHLAKVADKLNKNPIPSGCVIVFGDMGQHVAISAGGGNLLELDSNTGGVNRATVIDTMRRSGAYRDRVCWGPFPSVARIGRALADEKLFLEEENAKKNPKVSKKSPSNTAEELGLD